MSAKELSRNYATRYCLFYIDSYDNDAEKLPTSRKSGKQELSSSSTVSFGSIAKDVNGQRYVLNGNDEWVALANNSGSGTGSGSGYPDLNIATDEEVNNMLDDVLHL